MSASTPKADILSDRRQVCYVPEGYPAIFHASLRVWHVHARIVSPHGSLKLSGINLLALCPLDKVRRSISWISTPSLENVGVDRLIDVDVASVFPNIRFSADA